jgi:hypothetical protein
MMSSHRSPIALSFGVGTQRARSPGPTQLGSSSDGLRQPLEQNLRMEQQGGNSVIYEYASGVRKDQLTWPQQGRNYYQVGDIVNTHVTERKYLRKEYRDSVPEEKLTSMDLILALLGDVESASEYTLFYRINRITPSTGVPWRGSVTVDVFLILDSDRNKLFEPTKDDVLYVGEETWTVGHAGDGMNCLVSMDETGKRMGETAKVLEGFLKGMHFVLANIAGGAFGKIGKTALKKAGSAAVKNQMVKRSLKIARQLEVHIQKGIPKAIAAFIKSFGESLLKSAGTQGLERLAGQAGKSAANESGYEYYDSNGVKMKSKYEEVPGGGISISVGKANPTSLNWDSAIEAGSVAFASSLLGSITKYDEIVRLIGKKMASSDPLKQYLAGTVKDLMKSWIPNLTSAVISAAKKANQEKSGSAGYLNHLGTELTTKLTEFFKDRVKDLADGCAASFVE